MQRLLSIGVSVMLMCILAYGAWATESKGQADAVLLYPTDADPFLSLYRPVRVRLQEGMVTAKASYVDDPQRLLLTGEPQGFFRLLVASSLFENTLMSEAELAYSALEPGMLEDFEERQHQLLRFCLKGKQGIVEYGAEYLGIGKNFTRPTREKGFDNLRGLTLENDRESTQLWGKWHLGMASIRLDLIEFWDNINHDPNRPRRTTRQGKVSLDIAPPDWPFFSLSYAHGTSDRPQKPTTLFDTVETVFYHGQTTWDATLASTFSWTRDTLQPANASLLLYHELRISYRPTSAIYLEPTLSVTQQRDLSSHAQYSAFETSLSFTYCGLFKVFDLTTYGAYASSQSTDGYLATRTLDTTASLAWTVRLFPRATTTLSVELAYRRYLDLVYADRSYEEISGMLLLNVTSASKKRPTKRRAVASPL